MTRRTTFLLFALILTMGLVACGGSPDSEDEPERVELGGNEDQEQQQQPTADAKPPSDWGFGVTKIESYEDEMEVTLNENLMIIIQTGEDGDSFEWPHEIEDNEKNMLVRFGDESLKAGLRQAIQNEQYADSPKSLEVTNIEFRKYEGDTMRGFADIELNGVMTIKGVTLQESDGYFLGWPSKEDDYGRFVEVVEAYDNLKEKIKEKIVKQYNSSKDKK